MGRCEALLPETARVLASVHSDTAQSLRQFFKEYSEYYYWLGLRRENVNAPWVWQDGTPLDHTDWLKGKPNNQGGNENCANEQILKDRTPGWNNLDCTYRLSFICQIRSSILSPMTS